MPGAFLVMDARRGQAPDFDDAGCSLPAALAELAKAGTGGAALLVRRACQGGLSTPIAGLWTPRRRRPAVRAAAREGLPAADCKEFVTAPSRSGDCTRAHIPNPLGRM